MDRRIITMLLTLLLLLPGSLKAQEHTEVQQQYLAEVEAYFRHFEAAEPDSAEMALRRALRLMPEAESSFLLMGNLAELVVARGDTLEALELLSGALSRQPDLPDLLLRRAELLVESGRVETALLDYDRLVEAHPTDEVYRYRRVLAYEQLELWEAAEQDLRYIVAHNADAYLPRVKLAEVYEQQGRPLEAEKLLSYLIDTEPNMAPAYRSRARLAMRQDRKADALRDVREIIRRSGEQVDAEDYLLRGEIWLMYGEETEAEADFDRAASAGASPEQIAQARRAAKEIITSVEIRR